MAPETPPPEPGLYLYAIAGGGEEVSLGPIGLEGKLVFTVPYRGLGAVVHCGSAGLYPSPGEEVVAGWVLAHHRVVEVAWGRWGVVLPAAFGLIVKGEGESPEKNLLNWLERDYEKLFSRIEQVRGKAEYGVQVFWEPQVMAQELLNSGPLLSLQQEIQATSPGAAYLLREKLKGVLERELEAQARRSFQQLYALIKPCAAEVKIEKLKKSEGGRPMLLNLSCLVDQGKEGELGGVLEGIQGRQGFGVRFTGPFPPYSFANPG